MQFHKRFFASQCSLFKAGKVDNGEKSIFFSTQDVFGKRLLLMLRTSNNRRTEFIKYRTLQFPVNEGNLQKRRYSSMLSSYLYVSMYISSVRVWMP